MKSIRILIFFLIPVVLSAQNKFTGHYHDLQQSNIEINADGTFKYTWHFHPLSSWTQGTWTVFKDTIYFKMVPVYDTIRHTDSNGKTSDSLKLSNDELPELLSPQPPGYLFAREQNRVPYPEKLFFRKDRLYNIDSGKLVRKKKYVPWYLKEGL